MGMKAYGNVDAKLDKDPEKVPFELDTWDWSAWYAGYHDARRLAGDRHPDDVT